MQGKRRCTLSLDKHRMRDLPKSQPRSALSYRLPHAPPRVVCGLYPRIMTSFTSTHHHHRPVMPVMESLRFWLLTVGAMPRARATALQTLPRVLARPLWTTSQTGLHMYLFTSEAMATTNQPFIPVRLTLQNTRGLGCGTLAGGKWRDNVWHPLGCHIAPNLVQQVRR